MPFTVSFPVAAAPGAYAGVIGVHQQLWVIFEGALRQAGGGLDDGGIVALLPDMAVSLTNTVASSARDLATAGGGCLHVGVHLIAAGFHVGGGREGRQLQLSQKSLPKSLPYVKMPANMLPQPQTCVYDHHANITGIPTGQVCLPEV